MATTGKRTTACVFGGTGYVGSLLIKLLLEKGYAINAAVRDPSNQKKISPLLELQKLGDLRFFQADLTEEDSLEAAVAGSDLVFLVATPMNLFSENPENEVIKPAIQGALSVLKACKKAKTVKRVIYTSTVGAAAVHKRNGTSGVVIDENNWSDVDFLSSEKPFTWSYCLSKTLAEKAAWEFAKENNIDLVTVIPTIIAGPSLTPDVAPSNLNLMSLITGDEMFINMMKGMEQVTGSVPITHVEDVCLAHIFVAEKESASGRYICCAFNPSLSELAHFLNNRYPHYKVPTHFGDFPSKSKVILSSEKLIKEGFSYKYGVEEIYDQCIEYFKAKGLLQH